MTKPAHVGETTNMDEAVVVADPQLPYHGDKAVEVSQRPVALDREVGVAPREVDETVNVGLYASDVERPSWHRGCACAA